MERSGREVMLDAMIIPTTSSEGNENSSGNVDIRQTLHDGSSNGQSWPSFTHTIPYNASNSPRITRDDSAWSRFTIGDVLDLAARDGEVTERKRFCIDNAVQIEA